MNLIDAIWMAILQGIGEFLPISSSGHLVIYKELFAKKLSPAFQNGGIEIFLHLASLLAIFVFFRQRIYSLFKEVFMEKNYRLLGMIILATIPTGIIGILIKKSGLNIFTSFYLVVVDLFITGIILLLAEWYQKKQKKTGKFTYGKSFLVGIIQGLAVLPGISRSGSTIAGALFLGIKKEEAAEFSFLIAIPAIMGAVFVERKEFATLVFSWPLILSFILTFLLGILALKILFNFLQKNRLSIFGIYCVVISVLALIYKLAK